MVRTAVLAFALLAATASLAQTSAAPAEAVPSMTFRKQPL